MKPVNCIQTIDRESPLEIQDYQELIHYEGVDFTVEDLTDRSFEECVFRSCSFDGMTLASTHFSDCIFEESSFVLTKFDNTALHDVHFSGCKLAGVDFTYCNEFLFALTFSDCILDNVCIANRKMRKASIQKCTLSGSEFRYVDFREADFSKTRFRDVTFSHCDLQKADFRTAEGYLIDPESNALKNAVFTLPEAQSFLSFLGIKIDS